MAQDEKKIKVIASDMFRCGLVEIVEPVEAERSVQSIKFHAIATAKGNAVSMSVSDFQKQAEGIVDARQDRVIPALKRSKFATLFLGVNPAAGETVEEMIQSELTLILDLCEQNKPVSASGPVLREVESTMEKILADAFLALAGTSGAIPTTAEFLAYITEAKADASRLKAEQKAEANKMDDLGQFRLRAPKTKKEEGAE